MTPTEVAAKYVYDKLAGNAALLALLGTDPDGDYAIYHGVAPEGVTAPFVVFILTSSRSENPRGIATHLEDYNAAVYAVGLDSDSEPYSAAAQIEASLSGTTAAVDTTNLVRSWRTGGILSRQIVQGEVQTMAGGTYLVSVSPGI